MGFVYIGFQLLLGYRANLSEIEKLIKQKLPSLEKEIERIKNNYEN